jgi:ATP-dependent Lon protease
VKNNALKIQETNSDLVSLGAVCDLIAKCRKTDQQARLPDSLRLDVLRSAATALLQWTEDERRRLDEQRELDEKIKEKREKYNEKKRESYLRCKIRRVQRALA